MTVSRENSPANPNNASILLLYEERDENNAIKSSPIFEIDQNQSKMRYNTFENFSNNLSGNLPLTTFLKQKDLRIQEQIE